MASPKLILIVDDYDHVARFLARLVKATTAFNAISAESGEQAIRLAQERSPDAALLDVDMAGLDGFETARALRQLFGAARPMLIAMTEKVDVDRAQLSPLFDVVLIKPIDIEMLLPLFRDL